MNLRTPRAGLVALALFTATGIALFLFLLARFGGPGIGLSDPLTLHASLPDSQGLSVRSDVRVRGVRVGRVKRIETRGDRAEVVIELGDDATARRGAWVRVGQKTLLGEAYIELDPGAHGGPALPRDAVLPVRPTVEVDEALSAFGPQARRDLQGVLAEAGRATAPRASGARLSATLGELRRFTAALRRVGGALRDQRDDLSAAVDGSRAVLGELSARSQAVRGLVRDGRRALEATAGAESSLRAGLDEVPRFEAEARSALAAARPLLTEARPLTRRLREASPPLRAALDDLPPAAADLRAILAGAPRLERAAVPLLRSVDALLPALRPAVRRLQPALANLVPMLRYLEPRKDAIAAWFTNTADLGLNGDAKGKWARFFIFADPTTLLGLPGGAPAGNAYPAPGDAAGNRAYAKGSYPRLLPFRP